MSGHWHAICHMIFTVDNILHALAVSWVMTQGLKNRVGIFGPFFIFDPPIKCRPSCTLSLTNTSPKIKLFMVLKIKLSHKKSGHFNKCHIIKLILANSLHVMHVLQHAIWALSPHHDDFMKGHWEFAPLTGYFSCILIISVYPENIRIPGM